MNGFSAKHRGQALAVAAMMLSCAITMAPAMSAGLSSDCADDLDRAVLMDSNGESERARRLFETLESSCQSYPQVAHNLGVLAGREGDWEKASHHFERAIEADQRAAMSLEHLRQIHRYRAGQAWRKALNASLDPGVEAPEPTLSLQDSSLLNSDSNRVSAASTELRTVSTIEYELFDWWQNAVSNNKAGWLAHYSRGFEAPKPLLLAQFKWEELKLRISLTRHDAVVLVSYPDALPTTLASSSLTTPMNSEAVSTEAATTEASTTGSLLLLRLEGNRWKIYEQSSL